MFYAGNEALKESNLQIDIDHPAFCSPNLSGDYLLQPPHKSDKRQAEGNFGDEYSLQR